MKKLIPIFILLLLLSLTAVSAESSQSDILSNDNPEKSFDEIQTDIKNASAGDTIEIDGKYVGNAQITVYNKNLNFEGKNDAKLNSKNSQGIMDIVDSNVNIKNVCFANAKTPSIISQNSNLTLIGCSFEDNQNGIQFTTYCNSTLTIVNCTFKNNTNPIYTLGNGPNIRDCEFNANAGNLITVYGSNTLISNCKFINNPQGKITVDLVSSTPSSNFTITNCAFNNFKGMEIYCNDVFIRNSSFINNMASPVVLYGLNEEIANCRFINNSNTALLYGGHSRFYAFNLTYDGHERFRVLNSTFENNIDSYGAAIGYEDKFDGVKNIKDNTRINVNEGLIDNCTFKNNRATTFYGGAIRYYSYYNGGVKVHYSRMTIQNSKFVDNYAENGGGAVYMYGDDNYITGCNFTDASGLYGAFIFVEGNNAIVDDCRFKNPKITQYEGAVFYRGDKTNIINCVFEDLKSNNTGAIIAELSNGGKANIENCSFKNIHMNTGSVIYASGDVKINLCEITNISSYMYSAVSATKGKAEITNSKFENSVSSFGMIKMTDNHFLTNNTYSDYTPGPFIITKWNSEGNFTTAYVYDINFNRIELVDVKLSEIKGTYDDFGVDFTCKIIPKYASVNIKDDIIILFHEERGYEEEIFPLGNDKYTYPVSLNAGTHKVTLTFNNIPYTIDPIMTTVKIAKLPTTVNAKKVTFKYKKTKYFKIKVKAKGMVVKNLGLKVKIGKKTYNLKTDKNGIAKFNTKKLKVGKHKVVITSTNNNYKLSAKSQITIKKRIK